MKVLFVSSGNSKVFKVQPFIKSQGESLRHRGIEVEYFPVIGKGFSGYRKNISKLKKTISDQKIDIVHAHYSLTGWVVYFASPGKPRVLSLMGSDTHGGNIKKSSHLFMSIQLFLIQFLFPKIIVKSGNLSSILWARRKAEIIPNGVNFHLFKPMNKLAVRKMLGLKPDGRYILFMANPDDSNKNFKLLSQAMEYVQAEAEVLTPYPVDHVETVLYYNACECSPNVIKESLVCNTNIIATPSCDVVERTKGLKNVLISEYNANDIAEKINYFLQNNINFNARDAVREELDEVLIADKIINIYKSLLN